MDAPVEYVTSPVPVTRAMTLAEVMRQVESLNGDPWQAVQQLAASGDRSLIPSVQAALERYLDEGEWYGRDMMAYVLAGIRGTAAFPLLLRAFARPVPHDDRDSFCALLGDLIHIDPDGCRPTILSFATDGHPDLRNAGLWALGYVVRPGDLDLLRQALTDPDPRLRQTALGTLSSLKNEPSAYDLVTAALHDPDEQVRRSAVLDLRWFANAAAVHSLTPLTRDQSANVRSALGETIGNLPLDTHDRPAALDALLLLLADLEPQVRAGAARGISALGGPFDALQAGARDPDPHVRAAIAAALGRHANPALTATLSSLAGDASAAVRADLVTALGACGWPGIRPIIDTLTADPDRAVRARAEVALTRITATKPHK